MQYTIVMSKDGTPYSVSIKFVVTANSFYEAIQKAQERKDDTRRKILLGSFLMKQMEDEAQKQKILAEINEYLTEDRDRKLFGL